MEVTPDFTWKRFGEEAAAELEEEFGPLHDMFTWDDQGGSDTERAMLLRHTLAYVTIKVKSNKTERE